MFKNKQILCEFMKLRKVIVTNISTLGFIYNNCQICINVMSHLN